MAKFVLNIYHVKLKEHITARLQARVYIYLHVWIRIRYWECGYGSTKLLNTDPIRIRIHNTAYDRPKSG